MPSKGGGRKKMEFWKKWEQEKQRMWQENKAKIIHLIVSSRNKDKLIAEFREQGLLKYIDEK